MKTSGITEITMVRMDILSQVVWNVRCNGVLFLQRPLPSLAFGAAFLWFSHVIVFPILLYGDRRQSWAMSCNLCVHQCVMSVVSETKDHKTTTAQNVVHKKKT